MKKFRHYLSVRSVRLGALAVLVATFVGLPALGRSMGTNSFQKLDAINYLSSVLLAEDYASYELTDNSGNYTYTGSTGHTEVYSEDIYEYGYDSCTTTECTFNYESTEEGSDDIYSASQLSSQTKQLTQMLSQYSNVAKDWTRFSSRTSRLAQKFTNVATQIDTLKGDTSVVETLISATAEIDNDVTGVISEIKTYYTSLQSSVTALAANTEATQGDVDNLSTAIQLLGTYNMLSMAVEARVDAVQQSDPLADLVFQIAKLESSELDDDTQDAIDELWDEIEELVDYVSQADEEYISVAKQISEVRNETDATAAQSGLQDLYSVSQEIQSFMQTMGSAFQTFMQSRPWDKLMQAQQYSQNQEIAGNMGTEMTDMKTEIMMAKQFLTAVKALKITKATVISAVDALFQSADKMLLIADKMKTAFDSASTKGMDQATMDKLFKIQDQIMQTVNTNMSVIATYLNENKSLWASSKDKDLIAEFLNAEEEMQNDEGDYDDFDEIYGTTAKDSTGETVDLEALKKQIRAEIIGEITREISATLLAELAKYIGDKQAGAILSDLLNKSAIFGVKGTDALQATTDVLTAIEDIPAEKDAVIKEGTEKEVAELYENIEEIKSAIVSDSTSEELQETITEAADLLLTGSDAEELNAINKTIDRLMLENKENLTDDKLQFNDMTLSENSDQWYFDSVMWAAQTPEDGGDAIVKGKGEGNYDAPAEVTCAEVSKMTMEAAGYGKTAGTPNDLAAVGQWYEDYVVSVEKYAPEFAASVEDWNAACPRGDVAVLIGEAYDVPESDYEGDFSDLSASDPESGYIQAMKDYGIMTGDSSGNTFRHEEGINRAEVATVIHRADESVGASTDIDSTLEDADALLDTLVSSTESSTSRASKLSTALIFLKAMLPLLN